MTCAGLKFLPPIPDPSKFFCVGKNNRKHREELQANKMLTEIPNEPTDCRQKQSMDVRNYIATRSGRPRPARTPRPVTGP